MADRYEHDWIDGRRVPPLVLDADHELNGTHTGTVHVEAGRFVLAGTLKGTLDLQRGVVATVAGRQQGTVSVASGATVAITGAIEGTATVALGATLVVEAGGKLAGTLRNDGVVVVRGVFGGEQSGGGELRLEDAGYVKQPTIRDGMKIYEW